MKRSILLWIITSALLALAGCSSQDSAPGAIETYLKALAAKDANQLVNSACAAWEQQAQQELRSFDAATLQLEDLKCSQVGTDQSYTLVQCTGRINASYGAEKMILEIANLTFRAIQEGGEWRMCGYK
jgi:hypothetical protein